MRIILTTAALALALAFLLVAPPEANAACEGSNRLYHGDSSCLSAGWDNGSWTSTNRTYWAKNNCSYAGKVVAKIDLKSASDRTWHLNDGSKRTGSGSAKIRNIYCCKDLSDFCYVSSTYNDAGCRKAFARSDAASEGCNLTSISYSRTGSGNMCTFTTTCPYYANASTRDSAGTVNLESIDNFDNCDGIVCDRTSPRNTPYVVIDPNQF